MIIQTHYTWNYFKPVLLISNLNKAIIKYYITIWTQWENLKTPSPECGGDPTRDENGQES